MNTTTNEHGDVTHRTECTEYVHADQSPCGLCYMPGGESAAFVVAQDALYSTPFLVAYSADGARA